MVGVSAQFLDQAKGLICMPLKKGLVHIYYGDGKGKTSAALGLALRAIGHGLKVILIQLMKGRHWIGEFKAQENIPNFIVKQYGTTSFINLYTPDSKDKERAVQGLLFAEQVMKQGVYDVVIIDESLYAVEYGLIPLSKLVEIVKNKPANVELVLTGGRDPPEELLRLADYVTHLVMEKHPYMDGVQARQGIDF